MTNDNVTSARVDFEYETTEMDRSRTNSHRNWGKAVSIRDVESSQPMRKKKDRIVFKSGECNVSKTHHRKRHLLFLADIFTTLVDLRWRWVVTIFIMSFTISWLIFAGLWYLISFLHGDFEEQNLPSGAMRLSGNFTPCVDNFYNFGSALLISIETQTTIGFGAKFPTEECPEAIFMLAFQSIVGLIIEAFLVGVVFAKLTRPKKRAQTLMFSRKAVICMREGQLCLMFRVGDMRKTRIISPVVKAQMIRPVVTEEGEIMEYYQQDLQIGGENGESSAFFIWPILVTHVITPTSPLYHLSADDLRKEKIEVVVILEGVVEATSMTTQARSSYIPSEVVWGHRFQSMVRFEKETSKHNVDYRLFDTTYAVDTPTCSAKELDELRAKNELIGSKVTTNRIMTKITTAAQHSHQPNDSLLYNVTAAVDNGLSVIRPSSVILAGSDASETNRDCVTQSLLAEEHT